ncbi:MAG: hypothetical protein JNM57_07600 [Cyclobacteriaceae bacterium]|nr:hypothetical protein [Cyclobacteriaceae bacterium]
MEKKYTLLLMLIAFTLPSFGQGGLKLTAFGGYTFQDKVYGYYGDLIIRDGAHYGGMLSFEKSDQMSIDLTYSWQGTTFDAVDYSSAITKEIKIDGSVNYIMLGASHSPSFSAKVAPYGGIMMGAAILSPKETYSDEWRFAIGGKLGLIFHANERVGIVLQSQLMVPVQGVGLAVGCGSGGCGSGVSTSSSATQFGFTGGVEIKLNN